jgi:hypothetical protein
MVESHPQSKDIENHSDGTIGTTPQLRVMNSFTKEKVTNSAVVIN